MTMRALHMYFLAVLALLCGAKAFAEEGKFDHAGLAQATLEHHIRPGCGALARNAASFEAAVSSFCRADAGTSSGAVKAAFRDLVLAWSRIEHIRFGPVMKKKRYARIHFWPDRKGLGRRQVAKVVRKRDESVTQAERLAAKSVALQGLDAAELLLYGPGAALLEKAGDGREFRCGYLRAIGANLTNIAEAVVVGWEGDEGFAKIFLSPGADNRTYLKPKEVTLEIAKAFLVGMERLRDIRIAGPLGLQRGKARRTDAAFEMSRLSTQSITANLEGLSALFEEGGLRARFNAVETGIGDAIHNDLAIALKALRGVEVPMKEAALDSDVEDELIAAGFPLKNAREETARVLAQHAGLSLGFNALDGD